MGYRKIIDLGHIVEVYEYQFKPSSKGGHREGTGEQSEHNYKNRQNIRRQTVRRLVTANFTNRDKFITLTLSDEVAIKNDIDVKSVRQCNVLFKAFIRRLREQEGYKDFKYVSVIEFQDKNGRGAVHYHMICDLPYIPIEQLQRIWGNGWVYINAIDHVDNIGAYVVKYMTKESSDKRLKSEKGYLCSKGLKRWEEVSEWQIDNQSPGAAARIRDYIHETELKIAGKKPVHICQYETDYLGKVNYKEFNLNRL